EKLKRLSLPKPSKQKHTERRTNHRAGGNGNQHCRDQGSRVVAHELAVRSHEKNGSQQERCEQAVQNGGPKKGFNRVDVRKVDRDSDQRRQDDDGVKSPRGLKTLVYPNAPAENLASRISRRSRHDRDGEKADTDDPKSEKQRGKIAGQWTQRLCSAFGSLDMSDAISVQRQRGSQDYEIHPDIGKERADTDVQSPGQDPCSHRNRRGALACR